MQPCYAWYVSNREYYCEVEDFLKSLALALLQLIQHQQQNAKCTPNQVFANRSKEEEIFPLTTQEIAEAQKADDKLKHCFKCNVV